MKRILIFITFLILMVGCSKEEVSDLQSEYFIKFYGSYLEDLGYDIEDTRDGNQVITGALEREGIGKDIALIKVDAFGNEAEWSPKYYGGNADDIGFCIKALTDGYLISGTITNPAGDKDAVLIRTDLQGNRVGEQYVYSGPGDDYAVDIENRLEGGYFIVGYSVNTTTSDKSFFVIGLDEDFGNAKITTTQSKGEEFIKIFNTGEGEYTAIGNQYSVNSTDDSQFFLVKLNETGNIFDLAFTGSPTIKEVAHDAIAANDSTIFLLGSAIEQGSSVSRIVIQKVVNFREEWTRFISGNASLSGKAIKLKPNGEIIIAADKIMNDDKNTLIYFLDNSGNVIDSREYGNSGDQEVEDILYNGQNLLILGKNAYQENSMISLIKTDASGNLWE